MKVTYNKRMKLTKSTDHDGVIFTWKDYADGNRQRTMNLDSFEFLRRFLLHVLPSGFMRIRYYGFLANRNRADNIRLARRLIDEQRPSHEIVGVHDTPLSNAQVDNHNEEFDICPECRQGRLVVILRVNYPTTKRAWSFDSS